MPAPDFARWRTQATPRHTKAATMTANAMNSDKLARMTPTTMNAIKIQGHADPGSVFFGGGSAMVHPLLSKDRMANEKHQFLNQP
jgi:poly(3-hydroxybutyrate) depolymerase